MLEWHHETFPDHEILYLGVLEYPFVTMTKGSDRLQIIPVDGAWTAVILDNGEYRALTKDEYTNEINNSIRWSYDEISVPPADLDGMIELEVKP